ncbi:clathrin light chain 2-like [Pistacia vera]|uniref:clathrin light chain 2-like n=1 Tax=Pistacia vera TaxID=55513 RepID=UPI001263889A|nr:clathrin light chain 2-like [Pistacia vera]
MSNFDDSFDSVPVAESTDPFHDEGYQGYDSHRADSAVDSPVFNNNKSSLDAGDDVFESQQSIYGEYANGDSDGPVLPPPSDMTPEEGFALREWRRENAIRLEEKEKREKEMLNQILEEADEYKVEFYRKRVVTCENKKETNREREKLFVANQQKFHAEADKNYWKAIAELIPNEVPAIEKKKAKKDQEKKPGIVVIQGPKPGKPTDLSRMRHILIRLKHNTPAHLKPSPPAPAPVKDAKTSQASASTAPSQAAAAEVVAAA